MQKDLTPDIGLPLFHRCVSTAQKLLASSQALEFCGDDPFDFLNSSLFQNTPLKNSRLFRLAWLQFGKRCPFNLRRLFLVPAKRNPKGVALFILGLLEDFKRTGNFELLNQTRILADWLMENRSDLSQWGHSCWGYHFDWQARAFFVPAGKPNIITSCYVARALYDLGTQLNERIYQDTALDVGRFISKHLFCESAGSVYFAYIPGEDAIVHNASLWGAAWCAFAGYALKDQTMIDQALHAARHSISAQQADGSWRYGAKPHHQFIDGFHTGYNLEALQFLAQALSITEFDDAISKGYGFYRGILFTDDGIAKYYSSSIYPLDMHNFAQAILTLLKVGGQGEDFELCRKVIEKAFELMYLPDEGRFVYQKGRWFTNKINYMRWTQSWSYYALAYYNRCNSENAYEKN